MKVIVVRIPGLAADDMSGGQAAQDALAVLRGVKKTSDCGEPAVVKAWLESEARSSGRGYVRLFSISDPEVAESLAVQAEALQLGARDSDERDLVRALGKAVQRLETARRQLLAETIAG